MQKFALIAIALVLLSGFVLAPASDTKTVGASATVNSYVSITLIDYGTPGIGFGSLDPNTNDNPADQSDTNGAIQVRNDPVSNKSITVKVNGANFVGNPSGTLTVNNAKWDKDNGVTGATALSTSYATVESGIISGAVQNIWFWLSIPSAQTAASYSSTFSFEGS